MASCLKKEALSLVLSRLGFLIDAKSCKCFGFLLDWFFYLNRFRRQRKQTATHNECIDFLSQQYLLYWFSAFIWVCLGVLRNQGETRWCRDLPGFPSREQRALAKAKRIINATPFSAQQGNTLDLSFIFLVLWDMVVRNRYRASLISFFFG